MAWVNSGRVTNPALGQVLVDTGPLTGGVHNLAACGACTAAGAFEVQHRDVANTTTINSQIFAVPASGFSVLPTMDCTVDQDDRLRIVAVGAIVGTASVSLWTAI